MTGASCYPGIRSFYLILGPSLKRLRRSHVGFDSHNSHDVQNGHDGNENHSGHNGNSSISRLLDIQLKSTQCIPTIIRNSASLSKRLTTAFKELKLRLETLGMIISGSSLQDKLGMVRFFQETFLLVVLGMLFLTLGSAGLRFVEEKFIWMTYTAADNQAGKTLQLEITCSFGSRGL